MTERQEVAAKLREAGRELDGDNTSSIRSAFCEIDHIIGTQDTGRTFEPFFNRLADLIDPACHMIMELEPDGIGAPHRYTIRCSNCGQLWYETGGAIRAPNYCPTCGSRVVSENE